MAGIDFIHQNGVDYEIVPEIAPRFKTTVNYAAGDCVIYNAEAYRFKTAHLAGAWIGTDAEKFLVGEELGAIKEDLNAYIITLSSECIQAVETESGYYNTANGKKYNSDEWVRSTTLIPFVSTKDTAVYSTCGYTVNIACYDKNKNILDSTYYAQAYVVGDRSTPKPIPKGTFYLGLNIHNSGATKISIAELPSANVVEYPFTPFYLIENCWATQSGNVLITESYDCVLIPVTAGDVWYTNSTAAANFICFDKTGTFLGMASVTSINNHGNLYTIPADAVYAYVNVQHNKTHGNYSTVYHKMTKGVKILCIGDSITWLDGQTSTSYDNASLFLGYQKQLTAKGYEVTSAGYSGYIYAVDGEHSSIYTKIVTDEYDVSGYDYIVLAGGTNDDLYAVPVGSIPSAYSGVTHDISTTLGALAGLIDYIRANNPTCKIILCTQLKSESLSRPYAEAVQYADGIRNIAKFESCYLVDLFENMNIQPFTDGFDLYFYDTTHPRKAGMQRMGALIAQAVESA